MTSNSTSICILNWIQIGTVVQGTCWRLLSREGWASLVAQWWRIHCQCKRFRISPWVGTIPWRRKWQPTPVFLPGKFHGQRSLVGYSKWGGRESYTTESVHFTSLQHPLYFSYKHSTVLSMSFHGQSTMCQALGKEDGKSSLLPNSINTAGDNDN